MTARGHLLYLLAALAIAGVLYGAYRGAESRRRPLEVRRAASIYPATKLSLREEPVGEQPSDPPQICHVQVVDWDGDSRPEVLVCDAIRSRVLCYRRGPAGEWEEQVLGEDVDLDVPAHATVTDLDGDGDRDVVVSILGDLWPTDEHWGQIVWIESVEGGGFVNHRLLDGVRRVADVQAGDLDGDGDLDLVAAVFGYDRGEIIWLEQVERGKFRDRGLLYAPGTIHVPLADFDGDGDLDIAAVVSQDQEEVWGFENLGGGRFAPRRRLLRTTANFDLGSAGLVATDLDQDGLTDLLLPMGDNLEVLYHYPQPHHGCLWLKNRGGWRFEPQRIAEFGGTYGAAAGDLDGDGDLDVALVSMFNDWTVPGAASLIWLENDGRMHFTPWQVAERPIHLTTVACGDLDGDGRDDIVAGGLHLLEPFDRLGRVTAWLSGGESPAKSSTESSTESSTVSSTESSTESSTKEAP